jgi:iron complex outermembrane receptor protein
VRLNDPQSGHHNGDIPVPLEDVERIEVLHGVGSSLFGADAFGGTVNVITRRSRDTAEVKAHGGSFGMAGASGGAGFAGRGVTQTVAASLDRSAGFIDDRDFNTTMFRSRTTFGASSGVTVAFQRKEFGALNFYGRKRTGEDAPSREWTNQTLVDGHHRLGEVSGWALAARGSYRTHGDLFIFDQLNPQDLGNRHRTHVALADVVASRRVGSGTVAAGFEGGGDWIRSTNLGDHELARVSGFGEWRQPIGRRAHLDAALRFDRYTEFGASWSPSVGVGWWPSASVRVRGTGGRAFRVPTFTERYYSDQANLARPDVGPEHAWAGEVGADVFVGRDWVVQGTFFGRADSDVIDWLRPTTADLWQTYNVRDVDTRGVELSVRRSFGSGAFVVGQFTALDVDAPSVDQLSKYILDYASHSAVAAGSFPLPWAFRVAPRMEYRRRSRQTSPEEYVLLDVRVARRFGSLVELRVDGVNLFDRTYHEIAGVVMPGVAVIVSASISGGR